jgi:hypothetical protein
MIGRWRRAATVIAVVLGIGVGLGLRSADASRADPPGAAARLGRLSALAAGAEAAVDRLEGVLTEAIDHARRGSALTVAGDEAPAPELLSAAEIALTGQDAANAARRELRELVGAAAAIVPGAIIPVISYDGTELRLISAQLRASARAATEFVERRHATQAVVDALAAALLAIENDDPQAALDSLDAAQAPFALLEAWDQRPALLRYWMTVSGDLLQAAREIAAATIDGDAEAVEAAARRYAEAAERAQGADNAAAFALSEAGAAVAAVPLLRLASAAGEVADLRAALEPLLRPAS